MDVPRSMHRVVSATLATMLAMSALLVSAGSASAAWSQPAFVRSIGGIGRPGVFAWGLAFNPVSHEVIVGDYLNFRVRRYADGGARYLGDLPVRPGEVWATGVDPTTGDIYYSSNWDDSIERFDRIGNHLRTVRVSGGWNSWFDVDQAGTSGSMNGSPQSTSYSIQRYRNDGTRLNSWTLPNIFPRAMTIFGIGVTSDDRVYLPDSNNQQIQVYQFNRSSGSPDLRSGVRLDGPRHRSAGGRVRRDERVGLHLRLAQRTSCGSSPSAGPTCRAIGDRGQRAG